ncbi:hypothetical protein [Burkholderia cenocepacia]|nr:hypothetical protein [Burkholderia cenocepacia]
MAMNRWMAGPSAPVPAGAAVRLLRGQQSLNVSPRAKSIDF